MKSPELIIIDDIVGLQDLEVYLQDKEYIAYDCETTGLTKHHEVIGFSVCAEENKAYYVILAKWNKEENRLDYTEANEASPAILNVLHSKKLIMHNAIFDCMMAEFTMSIRLINSLHTDTMLLAHLLDENRRVGLKELAKTMYGESATEEQTAMKASIIANGGSVTKTQYDLYKADANLIGKYGAKDALLTYKLFLDLVPELYAQGLDKFFYEEESMPLLKGPTHDLNTTGLVVDVKEMQILKKTLEAECLEAKDFINAEIAGYINTTYPGTSKKKTFNISSSQQLSWLLFGVLSLEFGTLTKGGKTICKELGLKLPYSPTAKREFIRRCLEQTGQIYQPAAIVNGKKRNAKRFSEPWKYIACDKTTLKKFAPKYKWIATLLDYQRKTKLLNTYIEGIEQRLSYGVVTSSYLQHGTMTGRYASRNPNLQNLPREDQRIKKFFVSRPGKVFVSADQSQLEPRIFAYYSQDPRLMGAFDGKSDFYSVVGIEVYDKFDATPQKDGSEDAFGVKYKKLRDGSKTFALASAYGSTAHQLAIKAGKSTEDMQEDMDKYFETFPGVKKQMLEAHAIAKGCGEVTSLFGRKRRLPDAKNIVKLYGNQAHADLPYEARNLLNMACNFRIQSTGASIINRAIIKFYDDIEMHDIDCKLVSQIHDELVIECNESDAERVKSLLQRAMETATVLEGIGFEAIPRISKNLAK